jgi:hypothetical protein
MSQSYKLLTGSKFDVDRAKALLVHHIGAMLKTKQLTDGRRSPRPNLGMLRTVKNSEDEGRSAQLKQICLSQKNLIRDQKRRCRANVPTKPIPLASLARVSPVADRRSSSELLLCSMQRTKAAARPEGT